MGIFDRFRAQPKWKHPDPAVRLAAVEELPLDEQGVLATLSREDADGRVRRAAVRKVYDPALLKDVIEGDQDAGVREEAASVLLDLAVGAFEDSSETESLKALEQLVDPRHLATVAKTASSEAVSLAALGRIADPKAIGSIARRSAHAATRLNALARVEDPEEVLAIAMKSDHRDVALAALERLTAPEHVRAVASRGGQKAAVRRARSLVRDLDLAAEAEAAAAAAAAAEAAARAREEAAARAGANAERERVCRLVEALATDRDWRTIEARVAAGESEWKRLAEPPPDEALASRFADACRRARQAIEQAREDEARRAEQTEQMTREQAERVAVCEKLEHLAAAIGRRTDTGAASDDTAPGDEVPAAVDAARSEWNRLAAGTTVLTAADVQALERRFERAVAGCAREVERSRQAEGRRARLQELAGEAESVAAASPSYEQRTRWNAVKQEWADLGGSRLASSDLAARFDAASAAMAHRDAEAREEEQRRQRETLQRTVRVCEQAEALSAAETITLRDGERELRDLRAALDGLSAAPRKDRAELAERIKRVQAALFPRVSELREADEWVRWANVGIQEDLCRQAEALAEETDVAEAVRKLRELQLKWKQAAAVPRDKAKGLWERFKAAGDAVHARGEAFFTAQAAERDANLARKLALCERAEALAESSDWIKTAEAIKHLQGEWTAVGPVPRGHEKATWERFRAACDRFFTRRREDLTKRKEEWAANLARKEALIERVEALPGDTGWGPAVEQVKRAQAEWKTIGPVRKSKSEEVWERFRAACDGFFERYQQRDAAVVSANVAEREAICSELEALLPRRADQPAPEAPATSEPVSGELPFQPGVAAEPPEDLREKIWALRGRWQHAPLLIPRLTLNGLQARYNDALKALAAAFPDQVTGSALLDPAKLREKADELVAKVEKAVPASADASADSPTTMMAARLREALAGNAVGGVAVAENEARYRAASAAVAEAQSAWAALEPLPAEIEQAFGERFRKACARVQEAVEKRKKS